MRELGFIFPIAQAGEAYLWAFIEVPVHEVVEIKWDDYYVKNVEEEPLIRGNIESTFLFKQVEFIGSCHS